MEEKTDIFDELKQLSPMLAALDRQPVYHVPAGYFETLSAVVLAGIHNETSSLFENISKQPGNAIPEGYFDSLADTILSRIRTEQASTAAEELQTVSTILAGIQHKKLYEVPAGYFDNLPDSIMAGLPGQETELSPRLSSLRHKKLYEVPSGYFDNLAASIVAGSAQAVTEMPPVLAGLQHQNVYEVPPGYFDTLSDQLLSRVQPAKVVTMRRRPVFKYAAAAAVTGVMLFAGYKIVSPAPGSDHAVAKMTAVQQKGYELSKDSVKMEAEYANVSDADIVKFLQNSSEDIDAALVASTVDEKELPSQEDYLLDDKTLDNFLNNIDDKDLKN